MSKILAIHAVSVRRAPVSTLTVLETATAVLLRTADSIVTSRRLTALGRARVEARAHLVQRAGKPPLYSSGMLVVYPVSYALMSRHMGGGGWLAWACNSEGRHDKSSD